MKFVSRAAEVLAGLAKYENPFHILTHRLFTKDGEMTITDRRTGVSVVASRPSYRMFSETWYLRDYDVAGCPIRKDDIVVDVGANQGFFTCYAAQRGARVYSFEPHPHTFERLTRNVQANGFNDRVIAQCAAIADYEGDAELLCSTYLGSGANSLYSGFAEYANSIGEQLPSMRVSVRRLVSSIPAQV